MLILIGAAVGALAGVAVWWAARRFTTSRAAQPSAGAQAAETPQTLQALAVCLALTAWGAYVGWRAPGLPTATGALLVTAVLLTISLVDLRVRRIPNLLVLLLLAWAVGQSLWLGWPTLANLAIGLLAAGGFFFLLALLTRGAMGLGDVKLAAAIGALVGWPTMVAALFLGIVTGGVAALWLLLTHRAGRKDYFAYGPYLALGAWVVYTGWLGLW